MMKKKANFYLLVWLFWPLLCSAQKTIAEASLGPVDSSGFYQIKLFPRFQAYAFQNLQNLRLLNDKKQSLAYLIKQDLGAAFQSSAFKPFQQENVQVVQEAKKNSRIEIKNPTTQKQNHFVLEIKNSELNLSYHIYGSDNRKQWYVIGENKSFVKQTLKTGDCFLFAEFEPVEYAYYKIQINDSGQHIFRIKRLGQINYFRHHPSLSRVDFVSYRIHSEKKLTVIDCRLPYAVEIDQIQLEIKTPGFYKRQGQIESREGKQLRSLAFELQSNVDDAMRIDSRGLYSKEFRLLIENEDNLPLQIDSIFFFQETPLLICRLEKGNSYTIAFLDSSSVAPHFDLIHFENQLPAYMPVLPILQLNARTTPTPPKVLKPLSFWEEKWFLWTCIGLAFLIVLWTANGLIKDLQKKKT